MMTTTPLFTATPMVRGRRVFLAGIDWLPVTLRAGKNVKSEARRQGADRVVSYRYRDSQKNPQWVMGLVNWAKLALPKSCKDGYALALLIARQLKGSGYAIIAIDKAHYGFVSTIDGVLINDVIGDKAAIAQAQKNFLQFNREPEGGWQIFAPADWNIADSQPFDLDGLLAGPGFPASARFQATSRKRRFLGLFTLCSLMLAGYVGWNGYQTHQETLRQAAIRAAWLAQQQVQTSPALRSPWHDTPRLMPFINACAERWQKIPLSLAGWRFKEAQCAQEGTLRLAYSKPVGATVGDFAYRVKQVYAGQTQTTPYFNLPGQGDTGGFSQPVNFTASSDTRALPDADIARFVRVTQAEDGMIDIFIADNYREDFKVQHFVSRVQKAFPGRTRWASLSLDEIANVALPPSGDAPAHSVNQQRVLSYFRKAIALSASDVHFTVGRDGGAFCYVEARVHGELQCLDCIDKDEGMALASTIILSVCDVTEKQFYPNLHQDGRIAERFLKPLGIFGARYAHMPAVGGLYVVMRLIKDDGDAVPDFGSLGFLPDQVRVLKRLLRRPEGMLILSGPTGSGKSTTLRTASAAYLALWGYINKLPIRRLLTIEDPPEGRIYGAIQTPIIADKKNTEEIKRAWLLSMAYALRCDPDAILNGEIRDLESAITALKAAMTGHLLMTTLHANDGLNILERLEIEGVSARLLADPQLLIGLISQRLVQRLCSHCKVPYQRVAGQLEEDDRDLIEHYCQSEKVFMRYFEGCEHCYHGIVGRIVVAEVIAPDAQFFELYRTKSKAAAKTYWHRQLGGMTRNQHVLHYIHAGEVDPLAAHFICPIDEDSYTLLPQ